MNVRIFPIDRIKKGSRVIIYGAGAIGKNFVRQIKEMDWCDVVAASDKCYESISDFPAELISPDSIADFYDYDYVIIAIENHCTRRDAKEYLLASGVDSQKIIDNIDCFYKRDTFASVNRYGIVGTNGREDNRLHIAVNDIGSMGDLVISLKLYQSIVEYAPSSFIDVYVQIPAVGSKVFWGQKNLREICDISGGIDERKYDVIIEVRFEPLLLKCDFYAVNKLAPNLSEPMEKLLNYQERYYVKGDVYQYTNRVLHDRALFLGLNRYTLFNISGAFDNITDQNVKLHIDQKFYVRYTELGLKDRYITYNYGANMLHGKDIPQTKMWPYEYHMEWNKRVKALFPGVQIVQLGDRDVKRVPGADVYVIDEDIEVAKLVLQNALFHFDCEGGLVHIASQLGTKCFVVFGPTPVWFLGYEDNTNIAPVICGDCKGLYPDWYTVCHKYKKPKCMKSITVDRVIHEIEKWKRDRYVEFES